MKVKELFKVIDTRFHCPYITIIDDADSRGIRTFTYSQDGRTYHIEFTLFKEGNSYFLEQTVEAVDIYDAMEVVENYCCDNHGTCEITRVEEIRK